MLEAANKNMKTGVMIIGETYYLKLETSSIWITVGSLEEAIAYLFASYFVFNLSTP